MRQPTSPSERWQWYERALAGEPVIIREDEPQCGYYRIRKFPYGQWPKGPWLPARVWMDPQDIDPITGELLSDERIRMTIDGKRVNPWIRWSWIAQNPITQSEWNYLKAMSPLRAQTIPQKKYTVPSYTA